MTMENGDGRPLDDEKAGGDDPQGWYFDLPGGAWERQEEKNRTLRQRVLGNISEDAEKAKSDPFARRVPDPEPPAKGGLFGFGRKKKQQEPPRESAGGTWSLSGSQAPEADANNDDPEEADDWSTEIPLHLEPPQDLTLRRHAETRPGEPWGTADAGWSIGAEDDDGHGASSREDDEDFRDRMQFWARGGGPEPGAELSESAGELDSGPAEESVARAADDSVAAAVQAPYGEDAAVGEATPVDETAEADEDFISSMRSWAKASPGEGEEEDQEEVSAPARNDVLQLRPRHAEPDEKRLDWGFQPAGQSETADRDQEAGAEAHEPARFSVEPDEEAEPADMLESMRRWAEHAKETEHPHFALQHQGEDEAADSSPTVIPLRPRNHDDHPNEHARADETPETAEPDQPRTIPIVLRSRTEPQLETAKPDDEEPPTRWNEFFGLDQADQADDGSETSATPNEGLAAMRDWAMKRPETEAEHEIPEEFLKPFDWELGDEETTGRVPAEAGEQSEWEAEDEPALTGFAGESTADAQDEPLDAEGAWIAGAAATDDQPERVVPEGPVSGEAVESDEDPLAGLFERPEVPAAPEKKRGGMFGRMFGRKKQEPEPEQAPASGDNEPGDWVLPEEESDVRSVASGSAREWAAAEAEDQPAAPAPYSTFADRPDAEGLEFLAAASPGEGDDFDDEWIEVDEPSPAAMLHEMVTAFERPAISEAPEVPVTESGAGPEEAAEGALHGEPAIFSVLSESREDGDEFAWEPEPVTYEEPTASAFGPDHTEEQPEEAPPLPTVFQLSLDALGAADAEVVASDAAAEPAEPVAAEPVTEAKPWSEQPAAEEETTVEAVASIEPVAEEPVADEKPWWEQPAAEEEAPIEAVASVEPVTEEPAADEKPWWEQPAAEEERPVEAVASVEPVAEESVADEKPWWEQPAAEEETPVEAVASVEPVTEEPVADEKPWWDQPASEEEPPVEAVASVEPVAEASAAEAKPWWEQPAAEEETPVEAVASVEPVAEEPAAEDKPWWEQPAPEEETPVEAVASVEPLVEEPVADEKPWWEQPAAEEETPVEAVASVEPLAAEPAAEEKPWWEQPAAEEETPVEAVASVEPVSEEPDADSEDDDPWAEFVGGASEAAPPDPAAASLGAAWTPATPAWAPPAPPAVEHDEDMWGDIAAQTEEAAFGADDSQGLDLAASLESQMAAGPDDLEPEWDARSEVRQRSVYEDEPGAFEPAEADEDVILRAFERHAATPDGESEPDPAVARETEEALAALFGQNAAQIVDESGEPFEPRSFLRLSGFAPQRESFDGNWGPEQEVQEVLPHDGAPYGGTDGAGFLPPPWAAEEFNAEGEGAPVRHGSKTKTWIRELVETGLLALLVFLSVRASFQNFKVDGNSMYPTLEDGQFLIVNKLVYSEVDVEKLGKFIPFVDAGEDPKRNVFHGPQRGDIVVLQDPRKPETDLIKRVIGLPGETVEIVGGQVYINDLLLDEPYITTPWNDTKPKILIPEGEYYVLGDNRDNSLDSRSSQVGLVPGDLIIGKAMLSYWPRDKFGLAPNEGGALGDQKPALTTKRIGED